MRYTTAGAFRGALEQRLATLAQQTAVPLVRLRKLVVFDRLMARLSTVAPSGWILKGAVALNFTKIHLETDSEAEWAINFYKKHGYSLFKKNKNPWGHHVWLEKNLN